MRRSVSALAALVAVTALTAAALLSEARGGGAASGPPTAAQVEALARLPGQSSLASQRIYFVMPDRYADGDPSNDRGGLSGPSFVTGYDPTNPGYYHGGDLKGLTANLQRIKDFGFTAIWVTPVLKQDPVENGSAAYHGYWGLDFTTVDPHLGTDQEFTDFVNAAHGLGLKVYLDVVVNHTADIIQLTGGSTYNGIPFRDCHGKPFNAANFVTSKHFPCLKAANMPDVPFVPAADRHLKRPDWLNDPLNYHDRGNIDFSSCSQQCFEQGDFYGLDDLFTERPNVMNGLAQIYSSWITRFHVDGFRVDTAKHVNAAFFKLWVPKIEAAARSAGIDDFPIFGEVTLTDPFDLSRFVQDRGVPEVLDFPFQDVAADYAAGVSSALAVAHRLSSDDYFRTPNGIDPAFVTFLGNHDMGRAAQQILSRAPGLTPAALLQHVLLGYDLLYLLRGAPVVMYGDEVGMIGSGGDQQARQDMGTTLVPDWQTQPRVGSPSIGTGSSFDVTNNPIEAQLKVLAADRDTYPALSTGATVVRYAKGSVLVVSRIDLTTGQEILVGFNNGDSPQTVTVQTGSGSPMQLTLDPVAARLAALPGPIETTRPAVPKLTGAPDALSSLFALTASGSGSEPVSITFAVRAAGGWRRLAIDDSAPYHAYLDPAKYRKGVTVQVVAVARSSSGLTSVSQIGTFTPNTGS